MNSNDALIAYTQKDMLKRASEMSKKKAALQGFRETNQQVVKLLATKPQSEWRSWTVAELKLVIAWKQGHSPQEPFKDNFRTLKKPALQRLFLDKYESAPDPIDSVWTEENEEELKRLQSGEIEDISLECGIERGMDRDDDELTVRLKNKAPSRLIKILTCSFRSLVMNKRRALLDELALMVDVDEEESIADVNSGIFDDSSDNDLDNDLF